jgi:hypothetical protein
METEHTEQPTGYNNEVERERQRIVFGPPAAQKAKQAEERRFFNGKAHGPEIAAYKARLERLAENNAQLKAAGVATINFAPPADLRDLSIGELRAQLVLLDALLKEQGQTWDRQQALAAEAERQQMIANETPTQRSIRILFELREADAARIASLEAELYARTRYQEGPAARPKVPMSNTSVAFGDGLTPGLSAPVAPSPSGNSPRRISR